MKEETHRLFFVFENKKFFSRKYFFNFTPTVRRTVKLFTPQYIPFSCLRWFRISLSFMNLELYGHFGLETMAFGSSDPLNLQKETSLSPDDDDREKLASMGSRSGLEWIPKV